MEVGVDLKVTPRKYAGYIMKISRSGMPFSGINQTKKSSNTKKSSYTSKAESTSAVATAAALAPVDEIDSPIYDAMEEASSRFAEGESLEDATEAVVSAVIHEHFGKKGLPNKEVAKITQTVTESINNDNTLQQRLESILRRITAIQHKKNIQQKT
jgi:hypothetical protein